MFRTLGRSELLWVGIIPEQEWDKGELREENPPGSEFEMFLWKPAQSSKNEGVGAVSLEMDSPREP